MTRAVSEVSVRRLFRWLIPLGPAALVLALSACGPPPYRFHSSDTGELVLKMPRSWRQLRAGVPNNPTTGTPAAGTWLGLYDAAPRPSVDHVQSNHATSPAAVMVSVPVSKELGASLTDDDLRNRFLPVTDTARQQAPVSSAVAHSFRLLSDQTMRTPTARGVHVVFTYDAGPGPEVYDQITALDTRRTRVHSLLVHCTQACYDSNRSAITTTMRSFTVKIG